MAISGSIGENFIFYAKAVDNLVRGRDIDIVFTGLQKGEKLHEALFYETGSADISGHEKIFVCKNRYHGTEASQGSADAARVENEKTNGTNEPMNVLRDVNMLVVPAQSGETDYVCQLLKKIVPQYSDAPPTVSDAGVPSVEEEIDLPDNGDMDPTEAKTDEEEE